MMKSRVLIFVALAGMFLMSNCSDKTVGSYPFSPRQAKKIFEAKSSAAITPSQFKRQAGSESFELNASPCYQTK
jgi:hypothetical protein